MFVGGEAVVPGAGGTGGEGVQGSFEEPCYGERYKEHTSGNTLHPLPGLPTARLLVVTHVWILLGDGRRAALFLLEHDGETINREEADCLAVNPLVSI